jgi:chromosome segregation ATPase
MTDEPENLTLRLLQEMRAEMREGFEKAFGDLAELRGSVSELQIALAATRTDIGVIKADVEDIKETARLIEGRLVRLEKHAGLLKA